MPLWGMAYIGDNSRRGTHTGGLLGASGTDTKSKTKREKPKRKAGGIAPWLVCIKPCTYTLHKTLYKHRP